MALYPIPPDLQPSEPRTWTQIRADYPNQFVMLTELELDPTAPEGIGRARVLLHGFPRADRNRLRYKLEPRFPDACDVYTTPTLLR